MKKFHFGENLRVIRRAKDISQEAMAIKLKISQVHYSRLERNPEVPDQAMVEKMAELVNLPPEQLLSEWEDDRVTTYRLFWKLKMTELLRTPVGVIVIVGFSIVIINTFYVFFYAFFMHLGTSHDWGMWSAFWICFVLLIYFAQAIIKFIKAGNKSRKIKY